MYDEVGSRAKHAENPEHLHARQKSKRALVEYSWYRSHQRNDAVEIARNFCVESLHMRFCLLSDRKKTERDVNPLLGWSRLKLDSYYFWNWWSKCMQKTTWQKLCCRTVILRRKSSIGYHLKFEERWVQLRSRLGLVLLFSSSRSFFLNDHTSVIEVTRSFERTTAERRNSSEHLRMFVEASRHTRPLVIDFLHVIRRRYITKALT